MATVIESLYNFKLQVTGWATISRIFGKGGSCTLPIKRTTGIIILLHLSRHVEENNFKKMELSSFSSTICHQLQCTSFLFTAMPIF